MKKEFAKGHFLLLSIQFITGLNIPIGKYLLSGWISPVELTLSRILFGTIVFWIISLFTKNEKIPFKDFAIIALGGVLGIAGTQLSFSWGLTFTTPTNFALIVALNPIVVLLMSSIFLKESINKKKIIGVVFGISGAIILITNVSSGIAAKNNLAGIGLAVINTIMLSLYLIIIRKTVVKYSPITLLKWMFLFAAIVLLPFTVNNLPTQKIFSNESNIEVLLLLSFTLIFATVLNNLLRPYALRYIKPTIASIYINLQPIIASFVAIWLGQDLFSWDKPLAALLVISGVLFVTWGSKKEVI